MHVDLSLSIASSHSALDKFIGGRSLTTLSEALTVNMLFLRAFLTLFPIEYRFLRKISAKIGFI